MGAAPALDTFAMVTLPRSGTLGMPLSSVNVSSPLVTSKSIASTAGSSGSVVVMS